MVLWAPNICLRLKVLIMYVNVEFISYNSKKKKEIILLFFLLCNWIYDVLYFGGITTDMKAMLRKVKHQHFTIESHVLHTYTF